MSFPPFGRISAAFAARQTVTRTNLRRSYFPIAYGNSTASASVGTASSLWLLESDFSLVRFIYLNKTATPYTIQKAIVAASAQANLGNAGYAGSTEPVNAAGAIDYTLFNQIYYNNGGADIEPRNQTAWGSGTATLTVPAGSATQPTLYFSDWVRIPSLARIDGGVRRALMVRHLTDATGTYQFSFQNNYGNYPTETPDQYMAGWYAGGGWNNVSTPNAMPTGVAQSTNLSPMGVQYIVSTSGFSVLGVGDSLTQGLSSATGQHGWGVRSCYALSTPALPISYWNQGWQSSVSSDYWANGFKAFDACKPQVVTIPVWTPNDGYAQSTADAGFSRAMDFSDYALRNGAIPMLMGPCPWAGITTIAQDNARLSTRTRMLTAAQNLGIYALDWEAVLGTGASPNVIQPSLVQSSHPNDAGNAIMDTAVFRPALSQALGLS